MRPISSLFKPSAQGKRKPSPRLAKIRASVEGRLARVIMRKAPIGMSPLMRLADGNFFVLPKRKVVLPKKINGRVPLRSVLRRVR
ncbi:MAG: hypothetical protein WC821_03445 [archaeon]|jgi:hypothetical protein